jgi:tripartite-type tricarboxylate transporter receptor subunit TctC
MTTERRCPTEIATRSARAPVRGRRTLLQAATLLGLAPGAVGTAFAQVPLRLLVGFPPGGGADLMARAVAERLRDPLGRPVLVENRPGAGGMIAAQQFKLTAPDGATLMLANDHQAVMVPLTMKGSGYEAADFVPIAALATYRLAFTVPAASPSKDLRDHLARAKADPSQANYGVPAPGSLPQFIGWSLGQAGGVPMNVVPYRGGAPLNADLLGGQVPASVDALGNVLESHRARRLRILAVSGATRSELAPDVPTFTEQGFAGLESTGWVGAYAPPGTPPAVISPLADAMARALATDGLREALLKMGFEPRFEPGPRLAELAARDTALWSDVVRRSGFTLQ